MAFNLYRLFGIVNRVSGETSDDNKAKFLCHVMEAETTGSKVIIYIISRKHQFVTF